MNINKTSFWIDVKWIDKGTNYPPGVSEKLSVDLSSWFIPKLDCLLRLADEFRIGKNGKLM